MDNNTELELCFERVDRARNPIAIPANFPLPLPTNHNHYIRVHYAPSMCEKSAKKSPQVLTAAPMLMMMMAKQPFLFTDSAAPL